MQQVEKKTIQESGSGSAKMFLQFSVFSFEILYQFGCFSGMILNVFPYVMQIRILGGTVFHRCSSHAHYC